MLIFDQLSSVSIFREDSFIDFVWRNDPGMLGGGGGGGVEVLLLDVSVEMQVIDFQKLQENIIITLKNV